MVMWKEMELDRFRGTGECNLDGYDLDTFIERYRPGDYDNPSVTTDAIIFSYPGTYRGLEQLKLLMIKRKDHPCIGYWALPGGFVNYTEDLDRAVARELEEETGVTGVPMCQLYTWGNADRDPRTRIITTTYMAVVEENQVAIQAGDDAAEAEWFQVFVEETTENQYKLTLTAGEIELQAEVRVRITDNGILRNKEYEILSQEGIAFDHAKGILQALDYLVLHI